jgi:TonB family protein
MNGSLNLKIFLFVSLGLHLLLLSLLTLLYPDFKINHIPPLHIEVSLFPLVPETRAASNPIPKPELKIKSNESHLRAELPDSAPPAEELVRRTGVQARITIHEQRELFREEKEEEPLVKEEQKPESLPVQDEVKVIPAKSAPALTIENEKWEMGSPKEEKVIIESYKNPIPKTASSDKTQMAMKNSSLSEGEALFIQPKYAESIKPIYPQEARRKGYEGEVILRVEVLPNGRVGQIEVKSSTGYELLDRSALTAVKRWKFVPAKKGEETIPLWVNIPVKFQLQ